MDEPIKKRRGRPPKRPINPEPEEVDFKSLFRKPKNIIIEDKPKKERKKREPKIILESNKKINCGFAPKDPNKYRDGTEDECYENRQFRLYGLKKISNEMITKVRKSETDNKTELSQLKIKVEIQKNNIKIKSKLNKLSKDELSPNMTTELKKEINDLKQLNAELKLKLD